MLILNQVIDAITGMPCKEIYKKYYEDNYTIKKFKNSFTNAKIRELLRSIMWTPPISAQCSGLIKELNVDDMLINLIKLSKILIDFLRLAPNHLLCQNLITASILIPFNKIMLVNEKKSIKRILNVILASCVVPSVSRLLRIILNWSDDNKLKDFTIEFMSIATYRTIRDIMKFSDICYLSNKLNPLLSQSVLVFYGKNIDITLSFYSYHIPSGTFKQCEYCQVNRNNCTCDPNDLLNNIFGENGICKDLKTFTNNVGNVFPYWNNFLNYLLFTKDHRHQVSSAMITSGIINQFKDDKIITLDLLLLLLNKIPPKVTSHGYNITNIFRFRDILVSLNSCSYLMETLAFCIEWCDKIIYPESEDKIPRLNQVATTFNTINNIVTNQTTRINEYLIYCKVPVLRAPEYYVPNKTLEVVQNKLVASSLHNSLNHSYVLKLNKNNFLL
jgi:hypothetical protein